MTRIASLIVLITISILTFSSRAESAPGDLDSTFGNGGRVYSLPTAKYTYSVASDMVLQPDGRIVVTGADDTWLTLARYLPNGQPDASFGVGGNVRTSLTGSGGYSSGNDVALQSDGKIVVIGSVYGIENSYILRYRQDGSLDPTFSGDGIQMIDNAGPGDWGDWRDDVAIQQDGRIVVLTFSSQGFTVIRLNVDGSYDTNFGANGRVTTSFGAVNWPSAIAIQPDGKIVVAGGAGDGVTHETQSFVLSRYNSNGSLDASFGNLGKVITNVHYSNRPADIVLEADNKLVVVGSSSFQGGVVMRFEPNGESDPSFGQSGVVYYRLSNYYTAFRRVAVQADGKIVASSDYPAYMVVRFLPNGSLDTLFGSGGVVITNFPDPFPPDPYISYGGAMSTLAIQPDGRIVGAGYWYGVYCDGVFCDGLVSYPAIARYTGGDVAGPNARFDFDGDGRSDVSVFRPGDTVWYLNRSTEGFTAAQFGISTDTIVPADYDGDGKTDIAVFRDGTWWWINSSNPQTVSTIQFGLAGDIPVPADYTGDGRDELAVYRDGQWWALDLSNGTASLVNFGVATDSPVPADYDGDGLSDVAVFRHSDGTWWIKYSNGGTTAAIQFGVAGDKAVSGDYTGDGKVDVAVWRPSNGNWYILRSEDGSYFSIPWGLESDIPSPGDYDGDGRSDFAIWRPSTGTWYISRSTAGTMIAPFGTAGDRPIPNSYVR